MTQVWQTLLAHAAADVAAYAARGRAFERLLPPWQHIRVLRHETARDGSARISFTLGRSSGNRVWTAESEGDGWTQLLVVRGPHETWDHTQRVVALDERSCLLIDHVALHADARASLRLRQPARELERVLRFRHERLRADLDHHSVWAAQPRLTVAVAGASGLIGSHLRDYLETAGHTVLRLVRRPARAAGEISWDPQAGVLDPASLEGVDAIINLAGVNLATLWTPAKRAELRDSRLVTTRTLVQAMSRSERPPAVFVSTSAVGWYGSRGEEALTEESTCGSGFLADLCGDWEAEARRAEACGVRVVTPRFGLVMSAAGGALPALLPLFRMGMGGRLGDGRQWWPWVALDDVLGAIEWVLHDEELRGPVNVVAPEQVTNAEFTAALGRVLRRPAVLAAPRPVLKAAGAMPREMLLVSQRVAPARLQKAGYRFARPALEAALRFELGA